MWSLGPHTVNGSSAFGVLTVGRPRAGGMRDTARMATAMRRLWARSDGRVKRDTSHVTVGLIEKNSPVPTLRLQVTNLHDFEDQKFPK